MGWIWLYYTLLGQKYLAEAIFKKSTKGGVSFGSQFEKTAFHGGKSQWLEYGYLVASRPQSGHRNSGAWLVFFFPFDVAYCPDLQKGIFPPQLT